MTVTHNALRTMLLIAVLLLIAGCGGQASGPGKGEPDILKFMLVGEEPAGFDQVLQEFERRTADTLNVRIHIDWYPIEDYKRRLEQVMVTGEEVDLVFDASFVYLTKNVSRGKYVELDNYFNNDQYPGLKKAFSGQLLDGNRINGKLYIVPLIQYYGTIDGIYIRKDLREKYGLAPIQNDEELQAFYDKVLENEDGIVPLAVDGRRGFYHLFSNENVPDSLVSVSAGVRWNIMLSDDLKKVLGVVTMGDPEEEFAAFKPPFNQHDYVYSRFDAYHRWNKYIEKDSLSQQDKLGMFVSGQAASLEHDLMQYTNVIQKMKQTNNKAVIEFYPFNACARQLKKGCYRTTYKAFNSVAIPKSSRHIDKTVAFLDWLFKDRKNHDLFEYGIEETHWTPVGDNQYKPLQNYVFPGYQLTWNPTMIRISSEMDEQARRYYDYLARDDTYRPNVLQRFIFNPEPVKLEIARTAPVFMELYTPATNGLILYFKSEARVMNEELRTLGLERIREEVRRQVQDYLDAMK